MEPSLPFPPLPPERSAWCYQEAVLVSIERPSHFRAASHAESCPVFAWLVSVTTAVKEPVHFYGGETTANGAVRIGLVALRHATRSWGRKFRSRFDRLARGNGFPATQPGHHIVARAQEHILTTGCRVDAGVGLLESAFVTLTLNEGCRRGMSERTHCTIIPRDSWEQMDQINLEEAFLRRTPMLKSVPHFLRREQVSSQPDSRPAGAVPSEVGWGQDWRRASMESVRPPAFHVAAQTQRGRQHRSSRVDGAGQQIRVGVMDRCLTRTLPSRTQEQARRDP